jgi:WD40 repeat protein
MNASLQAPGTIGAVTFSPDGRTLAAGSSRTVTLLDLATQQEVSILKGHLGSIWSLAFTPDGNTLASGSLDGTVRLWRTASFAETDAPAGARRLQASQ